MIVKMYDDKTQLIARMLYKSLPLETSRYNADEGCHGRNAFV